ncbi:MAG: AsmA-like C-terminal region-containing protein [Ferruginibacter sp.]
MKKSLKLLFKAFKIIIAVLLLIYILVFAYVSINKRSIIEQVTSDIGKKLNGRVAIGDVELSFFRHFPKISVLMKDIVITDSMYATHNHPFFKAVHVFAQLNIMKVIKKQPPLSGLRIENGQIYFYTAADGYTNTYLFKQKKDSSNTKVNKGKSDLRSIVLKDVSFTIDDKRKDKLHNYFVNELKIKLDDNEQALLMNTEADVVIHSMAFNLARGTFLKEKNFKGDFQLRFDKRSTQLQFDSIDIRLSGQRFNLTGRFDMKGEAPQFSLQAHAKQIGYEDGKTLLPERIAKSLAIVELDKPLDVDVNINGPLKGGEPLLNVNWKASGTQLKSPFLDFENASFTGYYTNEVEKGLPRKDPNSIIDIENFSADWHGLPLTSHNIEILNLSEPILTCDLLSQFPLEKLNELIGSSSIQLQSGKGNVNLTYKGPIVRNNNTNSLVNGFISFENGNLLYAPRDVEMKNLNGRLVFKNSDVMVENLQCVVLDNKIVMGGLGKNLLTLINTEPGKATVDWSITTPSLNLGSFIYLLKPGKKTRSSKNKSSVSNAASKIDDIVEKASFHVNLHAASLYYKKFQASNVNADVTLLEDKYLIKNVSMNHSGGSIEMDGSIINQNKDYQQAKLHAFMNNVDVNKVFNAFEDFGQDGISAQNLEGKLTARIDASMMLQVNGKVLPSSVQSIIDFSLKNGGLNNYEPVKKMQNIIFKKRDFENIRFAELKNRLEISNREVKINRMEIQSSVLSFFVEGLYSMKGNTDISIQVPLNNLKKRGADYNPENIGTDKKGGKSIYLRGRTGSDGNVAFKIDLFNKFKKEKESK